MVGAIAWQMYAQFSAGCIDVSSACADGSASSSVWSPSCGDPARHACAANSDGVVGRSFWKESLQLAPLAQARQRPSVAGMVHPCAVRQVNGALNRAPSIFTGSRIRRRTLLPLPWRQGGVQQGPDKKEASAARTAHALGNRLEGNEGAEARLG